VIVPGVTLMWQAMGEIIPGLAETAHIYACDLRGQGRSDWAESGYRAGDYVDDIAAFVGAVSKAGTVLIGYSLGGLVVFGVAARRPDLVAGVIAIDPPLILRDSGFGATAYSESHDWIRWVDDLVGGRLTPAEAMARHMAMNPGTGEAEARQAMADMATVDPRATTALIGGQLYEGFDIEDTLDRVSCPTLVLAGNLELGSLVRDEDLEFLRAHTAHVRTTRIDGGGHGVMWDEPVKIINTEVADFFGALEAARPTETPSPPQDRRHT
jgi:pimeloyl-ACP methyl ester carboxylesterase